MPQIWMTYVELGHLLGCTADEARERAIAEKADRKKSRDGRSRVKLNPATMMVFIDQIRGSDRFTRAAQELQALPHLQPADDGAAVQNPGNTIQNPATKAA